MRCAFPILSVLTLSVSLQAQQPVLIHRAVVNAASLAPFGLPNGALARGSLFSIFGENLGPAQFAQASAFPWTVNLAGVTITLTQTATSTVSYDAVPYFVSAGQINAVLPSTLKAGLASLRVTYQGRRSNAITVQIADAAPGIFAVSSGGFGPGIVQNFVAADNQPINSLIKPATRGQFITIWGTGLGPVPYADNIAPTAGNLATAVTITIGGRPATKQYAGRSPCCAGLDQVVVSIPDDASLGCWVPVQITAAGVVSNTVTMAIAAPGSTSCSDPNNVLSSLARSSGTQGFIHLQRVNGISDVTHDLSRSEMDNIYARFIDKPASEFSFDPYLSYPPPGTCLLHQTAGDSSISRNLRGAPLVSMTPRPALVFNNGLENAPSLGSLAAFYSFRLGGTVDAKSVGIRLANSSAKATLDPGGPNATVLPLKLVSPPTWPQRDTLRLIDRAVPLVLNFTPTDAASPTAITLYAYASYVNATVEVQCLAPPGASTFTIPADTLANLPHTYKDIDGSYSTLAIGTLSTNGVTPFSNSLVANGVMLYSPWLTISVVLR
ncbi:MAG: hypothetical protein ABIR70_17885 [Bryobacteraceae bacterium]